MNYPTCDTCRFWSKKERLSIPNRNYDVGACERSPSDIYCAEFEPDDMATSCGHDGPVWTGQGFGCRHHEPFPVEPKPPGAGACAAELLAVLEQLAAIGEAGVIERRETGKPTWYVLDAIKTIARDAIDKANRHAPPL